MNLPMAYSEVKLRGLPSDNVYVPLTSSNLTSSSNTLSEEMEKEYDQLSHVRSYIQLTFPMSLTSFWAA